MSKVKIHRERSQRKKSSIKTKKNADRTAGERSSVTALRVVKSVSIDMFLKLRIFISNSDDEKGNSKNDPERYGRKDTKGFRRFCRPLVIDTNKV